MVDTKVCTKCGEEKTFSNFHKKASGKFGLQGVCKSCRRPYSKNYHVKNRKSILKYLKKYRQENKESILEGKRKYYRENKHKYRSWDRERQGIFKQQTPNWLTPIDKIIIKHLYDTCPEGYHVDHIVPLKSDKVSGLNVPWNLQHLPAEENIAKGNRYWPDMWEYDDG